MPKTDGACASTVASMQLQKTQNEPSETYSEFPAPDANSAFIVTHLFISPWAFSSLRAMVF
jgi:hypothetical protein